MADVAGPTDLDLAWEDLDDPSQYGEGIFVESGRVYTVRAASFPDDGGEANDALIAYGLSEGVELWRVTLPYGGDSSLESKASVVGARDGRVYATRSAVGKPNPILAFDGTSGALLWTSSANTQAESVDSAAFTAEGDLIVGDFTALYRIDGATGTTEWEIPKFCSNSYSCQVALSSTGVIALETTQSIAKYDLQTGAKLYSSVPLFGAASPHAPFLSKDEKTVYCQLLMGTVQCLAAWEDSGSSFDLKWSVRVATTSGELHGIGPDGTIYGFNKSGELVGLDPVTGAQKYNSEPLPSFGVGFGMTAPMLAVDSRGIVFVSYNVFDGRGQSSWVYVFTADLSTTLGSMSMHGLHRGGPVLVDEGTLLLADENGVYAFRCAQQASAIARNSGANPSSFSVDLPILGASATATVDLVATTGHPLAGVVGFATPSDLVLPAGQVLLVNVLDPQGEFLGASVQAGSVVAFPFSIPDDTALCGVAISTQAVHLGGGQTFALSNAVDLVLGG